MFAGLTSIDGCRASGGPEEVGRFSLIRSCVAGIIATALHLFASHTDTAVDENGKPLQAVFQVDFTGSVVRRRILPVPLLEAD